MQNSSAKYNILYCVLAMFLLSAIPMISLAETKPPIEPINIEADNAKIIEKEGKSVYSGNVVLIQGNTRLTADTITVLSLDGKLSRITAVGKPVTYHQANQPKTADISAEAETVDYFALEKRIVLLSNAKLTQGRTVFSGNRIEYNANTEVVTANQSESGKQRVQVIIHPEKKSGQSGLPTLP
ncbi:lipopolysaccharide transport periplasmic protein LptA [Kaarinaea lacus]